MTLPKTNFEAKKKNDFKLQKLSYLIMLEESLIFFFTYHRKFIKKKKTQKNRVEREVGGGIRMGNTCNSMADSCQCMTKPTTIL